MIKGFDEGLLQLREGSRAKLYIPSSLAYGTQSPSPDIPANANMIFEIEVLKVADQAPATNTPNSTTVDTARH
jgi:FKBP-type peptidyl-prolyl cis-trans isomerase FklB